MWRCWCPREALASGWVQYTLGTTSKGIPATLGRSRRENGKEYIRWCFADPDLAVEFADQFNGVIGRRHRSYQKK